MARSVVEQPLEQRLGSPTAPRPALFAVIIAGSRSPTNVLIVCPRQVAAAAITARGIDDLLHLAEVEPDQIARRAVAMTTFPGP